MMVGSELFRQEPRALAMAVGGVVNWIFTFIIALGFESVQVGIRHNVCINLNFKFLIQTSYIEKPLKQHYPVNFFFNRKLLGTIHLLYF